MMNKFLSDTTKYVDKALKFTNLSDGLANKIITCNSTYTVRFGVRLRGEIFTFEGWRSVHSEHIEPTKGGIRFDMDTHAEEVLVPPYILRWFISTSASGLSSPAL